MLILAPMHPGMLVYDLDQTEGEDIPEHLKNFVKATGEFDPERLYRTLDNAERMCILRLDRHKPIWCESTNSTTIRYKFKRREVGLNVYRKKWQNIGRFREETCTCIMVIFLFN
jgi:histidyl-tRNA synthetase